MFRHLLAVGLLLAPVAAQARIPEDKIKIGILQTLAPAAADYAARGNLVAAQLAASDFERQFLKGDAEILPGKPSTTPEDALDQVHEWLDKEDVDAVVSAAGPLIDQQILPLLAQRHRTLLMVANGDDVTHALCSPNAVLWGSGPTARAAAVAQALIPQGEKQWYIVADQDPTGLGGEAAVRQAVTSNGGQIVGETNGIFESDLSQAAAKITSSNAQVVALAEGDGVLTDMLRSTREAGVSRQVTLTAPFAEIRDIDEAGPDVATGLVVAAPFYWDTNDRTRHFSRSWDDRMQGEHVDLDAAETYAATYSFLMAAKAVEDVDSDKVLPQLRHTPLKDTLLGTVTVRSDGRVVHDMDVYRVKTPQGIQQRWGYYTKIATIPGDKVFPPNTCGH